MAIGSYKSPVVINDLVQKEDVVWETNWREVLTASKLQTSQEAIKNSVVTWIPDGEECLLHFTGCCLTVQWRHSVQEVGATLKAEIKPEVLLAENLFIGHGLNDTQKKAMVAQATAKKNNTISVVAHYVTEHTATGGVHRAFVLEKVLMTPFGTFTGNVSDNFSYIGFLTAITEFDKTLGTWTPSLGSLWRGGAEHAKQIWTGLRKDVPHKMKGLRFEAADQTKSNRSYDILWFPRQSKEFTDDVAEPPIDEETLWQVTAK